MAFLEASKWMRYPVLMSEAKLKELLDHLDSFTINISKVLSSKEDGRRAFEEAYGRYLQTGVLDRASLSVALTKNKEHIHIQEVGQNKWIARPIYPVVQVALFTFSISQEGKVLPHALGKNAVPFGIEFSYPAIYRDPKTEKIENAMLFESAILWKECSRFLRDGFDLLTLNSGIKTHFRIDPACKERALSL